MLCRYCKGKMRVLKTESDVNGVIRIRKCVDCGMLMTTYEKNSQERANGKKSSYKTNLAQK